MACVRNQGDFGPQVQHHTLSHGDYVFFPMVLFCCELFSSALLIQQFLVCTLLGRKEAEKQNEDFTETAEHKKKKKRKE